jgi:hypothetical protein
LLHALRIGPVVVLTKVRFGDADVLVVALSGTPGWRQGLGLGQGNIGIRRSSVVITVDIFATSGRPISLLVLVEMATTTSAVEGV